MRNTLAIILVLLTACSYPCAGPSEPSRPTVQQTGAVVKIIIKCKNYVGFGSGVVVSDDRVLTAKHVVTCSDGSETDFITVDPGDGVQRPASVEVLIPEKDIARLQLNMPSLSTYMTPVAIGPRPKVGDLLCASTATPSRGYYCGRTQPLAGARGRINWDHFTQFGNSGSGVYHDGKLIGLVVVLYRCQEEFPCAGGITPLQGYEWLVP